MVDDDDQGSARQQIGGLLQHPPPIQLADGLQSCFGALRSAQSGRAPGDQREQVRAVAQDVERIDRRLVLEQAASHVLHPWLGAAAVAGVGGGGGNVFGGGQEDR